jgi:hypothetical protein
MPLDITGTITSIAPLERIPTKAGTDLVKQTFCINTEGQYPKMVAFTLFNEKTDLLRAFTMGAVVRVHFEPSSREYNGKYYTDLRAWRIDAAVAGQAVAPGAAPQSTVYQDVPPPSWESSGQIPDDLPF